MTYEPRHLKRFDSGFTHCCFAGCTPMGCPGRCCVMEMGHRAGCPLNHDRQMDAALHEVYVNGGKPKHLAPEARTIWQIPYPAPVASIEVEG